MTAPMIRAIGGCLVEALSGTELGEVWAVADVSVMTLCVDGDIGIIVSSTIPVE